MADWSNGQFYRESDLELVNGICVEQAEYPKPSVIQVHVSYAVRPR